MQTSFALFADAANISQEGKLNILGIFDALHVTQFPSVHPRAALVVRLKASAADAGQREFTMRWINPEGDELWNSSAQLTIEQPPPHAYEVDIPLIMSVDLPLDRPGDYYLIVEVDGEEHTLTRLYVGSVQVPLMPMNGLVS